MPMLDPSSEDAMVMETSEHLAHNNTSMDSATPLCGMLQHLHLDDALAPTDVTFLVGGETFTAHRSVLAARSPAFAAELFKEDTNTGDCIRIDDMPAQVFKMVLHFIYTGSIPPEMDDGLKTMSALLAAADRLGLQELKEISEDILCDDVNGDIITDLFHLAVKHDAQRLHEACTCFLECSSSLLDFQNEELLRQLMAKSRPELLMKFYVQWFDLYGSYFYEESYTFEDFLRDNA